jgi:hypothetical protein
MWLIGVISIVIYLKRNGHNKKRNNQADKKFHRRFIFFKNDKVMPSIRKI